MPRALLAMSRDAGCIHLRQLPCTRCSVGECSEWASQPLMLQQPGRGRVRRSVWPWPQAMLAPHNSLALLAVQAALPCTAMRRLRRAKGAGCDVNRRAACIHPSTRATGVMYAWLDHGQCWCCKPACALLAVYWCVSCNYLQLGLHGMGGVGVYRCKQHQAALPRGVQHAWPAEGVLWLPTTPPATSAAAVS